ncbi:hypothetical protein Tco_1026167 [Tanacetum coccineum]
MDRIYHITLPRITKFLDKWNQFIFRFWNDKILVVKSGTKLKNFMKDFSVNSAFLLIKLETVCICISDLFDGVPELMHVDLRDFSSDQEHGITMSEFESIQSDLICGFVLWLAELNSYVTSFNL